MIDGDLFRSVLGRFATGVTVVTARDSSGTPHGMTVSAFSSLSLDPPLVLVCIGNEATVAPVLKEASSFAVNILAENQEEVSRHFASPGRHRFAECLESNEKNENGDPRLENALAWMQCRVVSRQPAGDHVIYIGQVEQAMVSEGRPLLYYRGGYNSLDR